MYIYILLAILLGVGVIVIGMMLCGISLVRNEYVLKFRVHIINRIYDHYTTHFEALKANTLMSVSEFNRRYKNLEDNYNKAYDLYHKYSYNKMLFSIKPLLIEKWYTEEEQKILGF